MREENVVNLILPRRPEREGRLNVKSIPSYRSSTCGLPQSGPGSDSQRGGEWMGGLIPNPLNTARSRACISEVKIINMLLQVPGIKKTASAFLR